MGTKAGVRRVWKRVAYATRYGKIGLSEAMSLDQMHLTEFIDAVGDIVQEENRANKS